jgi:hypothetical protein
VLVVVLVLENPYNIGEGPISAISTISERDRSNIGRSVFFLLHFYLLFCTVCFTLMRFPRVNNIGEGQVKYRKKRVFSATLLSFVLYSLLHSHEVPARQG